MLIRIEADVRRNMDLEGFAKDELQAALNAFQQKLGAFGLRPRVIARFEETHQSVISADYYPYFF